ncbi:8552_t:CDS:2 [Ambispora leptoticha]|uniref:8552_t:CDS:1 n=1 Tax=Ambispora leptoticha TaxID=144679 RepID=A0A9N9G4L0_9GLOM|nr:8552_t:CDS:2 [Ambispora leptoticha]
MLIKNPKEVNSLAVNCDLDPKVDNLLIELNGKVMVINATVGPMRKSPGILSELILNNRNHKELFRKREGINTGL